MGDCYALQRGDAPLLISVPHDGRKLPDAISSGMTPTGRAIPDTDWHVARLYDFAHDIGATLIVARYSRYVVDLNRPAEDDPLYPGQVATGLCPVRTFAGDVIYTCDDPVPVEEKARRVRDYWRPYHDCIAAELERLRATHGYSVLWDAHSIPSKVPRLFDGQLPELNIGTFDGRSCDLKIQQRIVTIAAESGYSSILNGRFKGGYITRHYGSPDGGVHAVQLEIAQRAYMNETTLAYDESKSRRLQETLRKMLAACTIR
jgi:N-formylglutamate amidohydrolase